MKNADRVIVDRLIGEIRSLFPGMKASVDEPAFENGYIHLDVSDGKKYGATIQWVSGNSTFGVSSLPAEWGIGPDEIYDSIEKIVDRVREILNGSRTRSV